MSKYRDVAKQMVKDCSELEALTENNKRGIPNKDLGLKYDIDPSVAGELWRGVRMGILGKNDSKKYGKAVKQMHEDNIVENISNMNYKEVDALYEVKGNAGMHLLEGLEAAKLYHEDKIVQTDKNIPNGITLEHIRKAVSDYNSNTIEHRFKDSRDYDVIIDGNKYPPMAIVGLAARYVSGVLLTPKHFKGGLKTKCFRVLEDNGFTVIPKEINIKPGQTLTNKQLSALFHCSTQGGMRRAKETNSLVLISNHVRSIYENTWDGDVIHYTGMGQNGDQTLSSQNKTVAESNDTDITMYLFEVYKENTYTFIGNVALQDDPYQTKQPDDTGTERNVWVFPLQVLGAKYTPSETVIKEVSEFKSKKAAKLSLEELKKRAKYSPKIPSKRTTTHEKHERSQYVVEYAKRRANGICQLCTDPAPFKNKKGEPYLETHHIVWLAKGGEDSPDNTVALCPNCHRRMHSLALPEDIKILMERNTIPFS